MVIAFLAQHLAVALATSFPPGRGATSAQALQVLLSISMVFHPVPAMIRGSLPHLLLAALSWLQIALLIRRFALCVRGRGLVVPSTFLGGWMVLLVIGLISWIVGTAAFLSPILFHALKQSGMVWAMQIANTLLTGVLFIPAANLFGVTFFVVEILSIKTDGLFASPATAAGPTAGVADAGKMTPAAPAKARSESRHLLTRYAAGIGLALGIGLVIVPPVWSLFPTGLVHERLCQTRSGEHIYKRARATSYLLIGEGGSDDGLHLHHALEDVTSRRVEFVEVAKDRANYHQRNSFIGLFGTSDPQGTFFRAFLGSADSPDCAKRLSWLYGTRLELETDQCLRLMPIEKPTSRYRVEAVADEQATWYTPHILSYGARVVDGERNATLAEYMRFARTGLLAFFTVGEKKMDCPGRYGFRPAQLHRKVLLGER